MAVPQAHDLRLPRDHHHQWIHLFWDYSPYRLAAMGSFSASVTVTVPRRVTTHPW